MTSYDALELDSLLAERWEGEDYSLFRYIPARYQRNGLNAATQLVLDFKNNQAEACAEVLRRSAKTISDQEAFLRERNKLRYVVALPRSTANVPNHACEWLAEQLSVRFPWLAHVPSALIRTETIISAHRARGSGRPTIEDHKRTIRYAGPPLAPAVDQAILTCNACGKPFRTSDGLQWHLDNNRSHPGAVAGWTGPVEKEGFLMLDDVITKGATSEACRQILTDSGARAAFGFFVGRTG